MCNIIVNFAYYEHPCMVCVDARADVVPTIDPVATFHTPDGEDTGLNYTGSAPLTVTLTARAADVGAYTAHYEWRFRKEGAQSPYLTHRIHLC